MAGLGVFVISLSILDTLESSTYFWGLVPGIRIRILVKSRHFRICSLFLYARTKYYGGSCLCEISVDSLTENKFSSTGRDGPACRLLMERSIIYGTFCLKLSLNWRQYLSEVGCRQNWERSLRIEIVGGGDRQNKFGHWEINNRREAGQN